jgi:hypothetical protein
MQVRRNPQSWHASHARAVLVLLLWWCVLGLLAEACYVGLQG